MWYGEKDEQLKTEPCCHKYGRLSDLWDYYWSNRTEQPEKISGVRKPYDRCRMVSGILHGKIGAKDHQLIWPTSLRKKNIQTKSTNEKMRIYKIKQYVSDNFYSQQYFDCFMSNSNKQKGKEHAESNLWGCLFRSQRVQTSTTH